MSAGEATSDGEAHATNADDDEDFAGDVCHALDGDGLSG